MKPMALATLAAAVSAGAVISAWTYPRWRDDRALRQIVGPDGRVRAAGWGRLLKPADRPRCEKLAEPINALLNAGPDDALRDAADALEPVGLWGWGRQPDPLICRELSLRAHRGNETDQLICASALLDCPLTLEPAVVLPLVRQLLESPSKRVRERAFAGVCLWAGRDRAHLLATLRIEDDSLKRLSLLAQSWGSRHAGVPRRTAAPDRQAQLRRVMADPRLDPRRRRRAAWRCADPGGQDVTDLLKEDPTQSDGTVYATVLVAERFLPRPEAAALAESWIRDFNDDLKRAGALLAMLLGVHADLLERAYELENVAAVRTTQRLALHALDRPVEGDDPLEFAYRILYRAGGEFDPDTALCLLARGYTPVLKLLTTQPRVADGPIFGEAAWRRAWLIERFAPQWHEHTGLPSVDDAAAIRLHFDDLNALRLLTQRRMAFDETTRTFISREPPLS